MCESIENIKGKLGQIESYLSTNECSYTSHIIHKVDWNSHGWKCKCDWILGWIPWSTVDDVVIVNLDILKPQLVILLLKALPFSWHFHHHTSKSNQHELGNLNWKIRQEVTLWFSSTHEKEGSKPIGFFAKTCERSSKYHKNNNKNQSGRNFTSNSKSKYNPNVTCHYCGRKGYIVQDCKDKAQDCANGVFKSQANIAAQGSSTLASSSSIETI